MQNTSLAKKLIVCYVMYSLVALGLFLFLQPKTEERGEEYVEHHPPTMNADGELLAEAARSPHWPAVRTAFLRQHPRCEACGTRHDLNVHHVQPFHLHPDKELDPDNLITLCRPCHLKYGHACDDQGRVNWSCENPNVRADVKRARKRHNLPTK